MSSRACCFASPLPWLLPALLLLTACLDDVRDAQPQALEKAAEQQTCSILAQNRRVRDIMQSWYLYVDQMPQRDPRNYDSPQAMLDALRVDPPDRFSFLDDREASLAFTEEGLRIGIGVTLSLVAEPDDYRVVDVIQGSPADEGGMRRGDRLLTINGRSVEDWFLNEGLGAAFGPDEEGVEVSLSARTPAGAEYQLDLVKVEFEVDPVGALEVFERNDGTRVGYMHFRNFIEPARERLDEVFTELRDAEVDELVLDMRYNGGGRIAVAEQLGGQIGGEALVDEIFVQLVHNEARSGQNVTRRFNEEVAALGLDRLMVIATGRTASASELMINGLRPFMDVEVIGDRTFGKPVGSYGFEVCDLLLFPTAFATLNANDEGDYFDGLPVTCEAEDQLDAAFGDESEASLAQALHYIDNGSCDSDAARLAREVSEQRYRPRMDEREGWHPETGGLR